MRDQNQVQAIGSLLRAIESDPLNVPGYCALAELYASAREFRKAEITLRRALEIDPFHHESWLRLGILHANRGTWRSAVEAFEHATALPLSDAASWTAYATALIAVQNLKKACEARDTLFRRFPEHPQTHLIAGHIDKIRGRFADAAESYRRSIALDAGQTDALFNLVDLLPPGPSDPLTGRLEMLLQAPALSHRQSANVRSALARIYEKADRVDEAFGMYRQANADTEHMMRDCGNAYDPVRAEREAASIIEMFGSDQATESLPPVDADVRMVFIVGLPRSGTTLVERILGSHSKVAAGGELPFMQECLAKLRSIRAASGAQGPLRLPDDRRLLLQLRTEYLDALFEHDLDADYVTDKLPANFAALGLIRMLFPDALIVHCVRQPIATCWSLYSAHFDSHLSYYTSLECLSHYCVKFYVHLMRHWATVKNLNVIHVRYEDLVANPEYEIRKLTAQCELPWEAACMNVCGNEQAIYTASMVQARREIYDTSVARWKKFEKHLRPLMESLRDAELSI